MDFKEKQLPLFKIQFLIGEASSFFHIEINNLHIIYMGDKNEEKSK